MPKNTNMPSKKRKYNARFPAGRIKKIMQTDEEVGKVAQAVPIIISRTLELFVESLLSKAMQVTVARNAKTLSPSHVKQCILAESKFDFLRDLVKNIPDVSAAEEKEMMSAESSPNSSRFSELPPAAPPRRIVREDSNSSSSSDVKMLVRETLTKRALSTETEPKPPRVETITSNSLEAAIDLTKKPPLPIPEVKPIRTANFYQETLVIEETPHRSVITLNPTYSSPQPSTSFTPEPIKIEPVPKPFEKPLVSPRTPVTPILNIDFTKNFANPEIKLLDTAAGMVAPKSDKNSLKQLNRQNSKVNVTRPEVKKVEIKPIFSHPNIDCLNSGNLQIDEDYDT